MKVLFYIRANKAVIGGDLTQLYSTAQALQKLGVKINYSSDPSMNFKNYDIVHIFNSPRFWETRTFFKNVIKQNKPIAFSTIFWPKEELVIAMSESKKVKFATKIFGIKLTKKLWLWIKICHGFIEKNSDLKTEKRLLTNADVLLPNSESEMREIKRVYHITKPYQVVRNAIDIQLFKKQPSKYRKEYVLSVGRVERRKNTLKLIKACHKLGKHLILIGDLNSKDEYGLLCYQKIQTYGFSHIASLDQSKLLTYYYEAKVHAMVSWYETPGLASMEAACGGCNIVTTDRGSTKDYFKDLAWYCNPLSQTSIELALAQAFETETTLKLRSIIFQEYTWAKAATDTILGYKKIIKERKV